MIASVAVGHLLLERLKLNSDVGSSTPVVMIEVATAGCADM